MYRPIFASAFTALLFGAGPSFAQVYKWVDEKGVVNYSNEKPADRKATQLDPKMARVSTIGADDSSKQGPMTQASANERVLADKIDRLERKLDAERYARSVSEAQAQTAADSWYQQCQRERRVDCDYAGDPYYSYGPYYAPVVVARRHPFRDRNMHNRPIATPKPVGHSASSPGRAMAAPRQM